MGELLLNSLLGVWGDAGELHRLGPHRQFRSPCLGLGIGQNLVLLNSKGMLDPKEFCLFSFLS